MSEKTEQPTPKRIRDSREKGDVCKGQDIAPAASVLAIAGYSVVNGPEIYKQISAMVEVPMKYMHLPFREAMAKSAGEVIDMSLGIVFPIVILVMCVSLMALVAQTGFLFAPKAATPKLENLDPKKWFQKVFSMKNLFEFVKNILKVGILGFY